MDFFLKTILVDGTCSQDGTRLRSHFVWAAPTVSKLHADFSFLSKSTVDWNQTASGSNDSEIFIIPFHCSRSPHACHSHFVLRYFNEFLNDCFPLFLINIPAQVTKLEESIWANGNGNKKVSLPGGLLKSQLLGTWNVSWVEVWKRCCQMEGLITRCWLPKKTGQLRRSICQQR